MIQAIKQIVAVGNRLDDADLPTTTPTTVDGVGTYASSAQGGLFVFSDATGGLPVDGDTYTVRNAGFITLHSLVGNVGDCQTLDLYLGPVGAMFLAETFTLGAAPGGGHDVFLDLRQYKIAPSWAVGVTDSAGGVTLARNVTLFREV